MNQADRVEAVSNPSQFGEGWEEVRVTAKEIRLGDIYIGFKEGGEEEKMIVEKIGEATPYPNPEILVIEGSTQGGKYVKHNLQVGAREAGYFRIKRKPEQS